MHPAGNERAPLYAAGPDAMQAADAIQQMIQFELDLEALTRFYR